jgi:hypothetical protein
MMTVCVGLFVLAWGVVRFYSVGAAVGLCVVAMVIPPCAAILANSRDRDDDWWNDPRWEDPRWNDPGHDRNRPDHEEHGERGDRQDRG